jgi:hypothetical protein
LDEHLAAIGQADPEACLEALADAGASLRQQWAIPAALSQVLNDRLRACTDTRRIAGFHTEAAWLPIDLFADDEQALLGELRSISVDTAGALGAATREARQTLLREQVRRLQDQRLKLGRSDRRWLRGHAAALAQWQRILDQAAGEVARERAAIGELPTSYRVGSVLEPGAPAFQGREDLFRDLEGLLINAPSKITPLLLGQPRTGKTSALKQLPRRLGAQVLPVFLDMERRSTAADAAGLLSDLVGEIRAAAQSHPRPVSLPPLDPALLAGDPYRVFENWIDEVEAALGEQRWLLLTLDEFDRIDLAVARKSLDDRIFSLVRSLIQNHPRVAIALCGNFTPSERDVRWSEALKNTYTLKVTFLPPAEARRVFTRPAPDFPADVYNEEAIALALELTAGQPYLLHLLGMKLVTDYNAERASLEPGAPPGLPLGRAAVDKVLPGVLTGGQECFGSIRKWLLEISGAPQVADVLLRALARGEPLDGIADPAERDRLLELFCERDLLARDERDGYRFQIPLIAHWMRTQRQPPGL